MSQSLMAPPARLGAMRQGDVDTRGLDLTNDLALVSDKIASITSVTVARRDGNAIGANDLTITPGGYQPPWLTAVAYGVPATPGLVVNWWQTSGPAIANSGAVDYQITITAVTTAGRDLIRDCYCAVVSGLG